MYGYGGNDGTGTVCSGPAFSRLEDFRRDGLHHFDQVVDPALGEVQLGHDVGDVVAFLLHLEHRIKSARQTDVLVVKSIDRLGRNYEDILEQWRVITKEKQAAIVVLDMPLLDTRQGRDLTGTLIADIVLQRLSYLAEQERAFIRQRQAEGIAAAKARRQRFGPPPKQRPEEFGEYVRRWKNGTLSAREASRQLQIAHSTFLKWARGNA